MHRPSSGLAVLVLATAACFDQAGAVSVRHGHAELAAGIRASVVEGKDAFVAPRVRSIGRCDDPDANVASFTLAHLNDLQARYGDVIEGKSRYAYVAGWLAAMKEREPATLVLDAGDDYEKGSIVELRSMGESTRRIVHALPIDARTIGNHDFAYGAEAVRRDVRESPHPVLAANVQDDARTFAPYAAFDVGCVRVGVVGLVTGNYDDDDQPTDAPFDDVFRHDARYADVLAREVAAHRSEVDVMIALDHLGLWEDIGLARRVSGVDLFVGGHTEDLVERPIAIPRGGGGVAYVVQAGHWGRTLGRAVVRVDRSAKPGRVTIAEYAITHVDASLPVDDAVDALVHDVTAELAPDAPLPIARVSRAIDARGMIDLTWRAAHETLGVDALVVGADAFWDGVPAGAITLQRLYDAVFTQREPAGTSGFTSLYLTVMTGAEIAALAPRGRFAVRRTAGLVPTRDYRVAVERRALFHPREALGARADVHAERADWAGELIDVLEPWARLREARGLTLD